MSITGKNGEQMNTLLRHYSLWMIFLLLCVISNGCNSKTEITDKYDGTYNISCISENVYTAIGDIDIKSGKISGTMLNTGNNTFHVTGSVNYKGIILFNTITSNLGKIAAVGQISEEGVVKGIYSVNTRKGKYFGFRYEKDEIDTKLNGAYQITFQRNNQKTAHLRIDINKGIFASVVESVDHVRYPIKGRVLKNGKIIINTIIGSQSKGIAAFGTINGKSLNGKYFLHTGEKGTFIGQ
jgi:hypothetical protein